jgi:hypothetical protein
VHAVAIIFVSAFILLTLASLLSIGNLLARRIRPPELFGSLLARQAVCVYPSQARSVRTVQLMAGLHLRAPPTFHDRTGDFIAAQCAEMDLATPAPPHGRC